jgi:hypothetical protein
MGKCSTWNDPGGAGGDQDLDSAKFHVEHRTGGRLVAGRPPPSLGFCAKLSEGRRCADLSGQNSWIVEISNKTLQMKNLAGRFSLKAQSWIQYEPRRHNYQQT